MLGQALRAAYATVRDGRLAHSLHAYFLLRGDFNAPIVYFVDRSRDGHSFTQPARHRDPARRADLSHVGVVSAAAERRRASAPDARGAAARGAGADAVGLPKAPLAGSRCPRSCGVYLTRERPFEFRPCRSAEPAAASATDSALAPAPQYVWVRAIDRLPDDDALHRCLLAYASDFHLLRTATLPHAALLAASQRFLASIDHAMWFHWPMRVDEWFLYATDSPSASGSRGFSRGSIFTREGRLVASTAQEGVIRILGPAAKR